MFRVFALVLQLSTSQLHMSMTLAYTAPTGNVTFALDFTSSSSPTTSILYQEAKPGSTTSDLTEGTLDLIKGATQGSITSGLFEGLTPGKPILRNEIDNTPGKCCSSDLSQRCCPYDYDGNKCEISDNRTLCGYDKNQEKPVVIETTTVKNGLICRSVNDRLECGYDKRSAETELVTQETTVPTETTTVSTEISTTHTTTQTSSQTTIEDITTTPTRITETTTATTVTGEAITAESGEESSNNVIKNVPWNCCSLNFSKNCCPYDYDDSKCAISDNSTVCGYNKNLKTMNNETSKLFTKLGLSCQVKDERAECGYSKGSDDTNDFPSPTKPSNKELLVKKETLEIHETSSTTETTTTSTTTATQETNTTHGLPVKPKSTSPRKRARRTTIECVEIHSKVACRVIRLDEELDYD